MRLLVCCGRVQREGEVIHVVADRLEDLSDLLLSVGERGTAQMEPSADPAPRPDGQKARNIFILDLQRGRGIRVPTRDFQ